MRVALVARGPRDHVDAILEHTRRLADAIRATGADVDLVLRAVDGRWSVEGIGDERRGQLPESLRAYDLVVVQYSPFLWGRRGIAPWLPILLWRLRLGRRRPRIALVVHEPYLHLALPWRWAAMATWQHVQLWTLRPAADELFVTIEAWTEELARLRPRRLTHHLPVGSNLPDARAERAATRAELGLDEDQFVVATLSGGDPTRRLELVAAALNALVSARMEPVLLVLGAGAVAPHSVSEMVRVVQPGRVSNERLARLLSVADLFLAPFADGVSTRRTSVMAALQHGLPVVATRGVLTDDLWMRSDAAVRLVPVDRPDLFVAAAIELAADSEARTEAGAAARRLYESSFDWSHAAAGILDAASPYA